MIDAPHSVIDVVSPRAPRAALHECEVEPLDQLAAALVRRLTGENGSNVVSYGTEAGQFQERGYSAVICGPGDIAQAHQPNEFVSVDQFQQGEAFIARLVDMLAE